MYMIIVYAYMI